MTTCNLPTTAALLKFLGKRRADMIQDISREDLRHCGGDSLFDIMLKEGWENSEGETIVIVNVEGFETQRHYLETIRHEFDGMEWKG